MITLTLGGDDSLKELLMQPTSVGIREAKIHLSKLLKLVKEGREVIVTDRGRPVGKITPIGMESLPLSARIKRLEEQGVVEALSSRARKSLPSPIALPQDVAQEFLAEERKNAKR
jgi:prevent-host-death family protein